MDTDHVDTEDLEVPTILRVQSPKSSLDESEKDNDEKDLEESTFKIDASRYSWAKQKMEKDDSENSSKNNDDESSSFLRMIMD